MMRGTAILRVKPVCSECLISGCHHLQPRPARITARDLSILRVLLEGIEGSTFPSNQDVADALGLKLGTTKMYLSTLYRKLKVNGRVSAALWARSHRALFEVKQ